MAANMNNSDMNALRHYITANDDNQYDSLHKSTLMVDMTHSNLKQRHIEIRMDLCTKIADLRDVIKRKTGTGPGYQLLQFILGGKVLFEVPPGREEDRMLGYFGLEHGVTIHCVDLDPNSGSKNGQYEDVSLVKKYVMSDDEYNKRKGTLRDWERQQKAKDSTFTLAKHAREHREMADARRQAKLGLPLPAGFEMDVNGETLRLREERVAQPTTKGSDPDAPGAESVEGIEVGMRCEVRPGSRRGAIQYIGVIQKLGGGGYWCGVKFDEPVGRADGTIKGERYFEALPGYGGFVRGKNVEVGDFPERDIFDELDDSEDEL